MSATTSTTVDQPTTRAPRWPLVVIVAALLPLGVLGALVLSASSTVAKAAWHGVPLYALPAAVAVLELVSFAGSGAAVFGRTLELRRAGYVATALSTLVTASAGWSAYGWFGLVGPGALLGLVHLASLALRELLATSAGSSTASTTPATTPTAPLAEPLTSEESAQAPAPEPVLDEPAPEPVVEPVGLDDRPVEGPLTLVDELRSRPTLPSERALVAELDPDGRLGTTRHFAKVVLREAKTGLSAVAA